MLLILWMSALCLWAKAGTADSLTHYLRVAARHNPQVQADYMAYRAACEKIPQAGAFEDPELEMGFYLRPMETLMGKQVAEFTLMQMFPWFGTRKAARGEAAEMARMEYEKFRAGRDALWFELKQKWYRLATLKEQHDIVQANLQLLDQLEKLALSRFSASALPEGSNSTSPAPASAGKENRVSASPSGSMSGMGGMNGMNGGMNANPPVSGTASMGNMGGMGGAMTQMNSAAGGMSDVLRIRIERASLEDEAADLLSDRHVEEAAFNALLNRDARSPIALPDSLEQLPLPFDGKQATDSIFAHNPMLTMLDAEAASYRAMARMQRRMSYPMIGIGLQYMPLKAMPAASGGMEGGMEGMRTMSGTDMGSMNGQDMFMPMLKISLPLFRGKYNARQREYKSLLLASGLKRDNVRNQLHVEYLQACKQMDDAARKIARCNKQRALTESVWQLIVKEFATGRQPLSEVIATERQLSDYRRQRAEAVADYNTAVATLEKLVSTTLITDPQ